MLDLVSRKVVLSFSAYNVHYALECCSWIDFTVTRVVVIIHRHRRRPPHNVDVEAEAILDVERKCRHTDERQATLQVEASINLLEKLQRDCDSRYDKERDSRGVTMTSWLYAVPSWFYAVIGTSEGKLRGKP